MQENIQKLRNRWKKGMDWVRANVPPGGRALVGLLLIIGGLFGFLPVLGFWMGPLRVAVLAMDIGALVQAVKRSLGRW